MHLPQAGLSKVVDCASKLHSNNPELAAGRTEWLSHGICTCDYRGTGTLPLVCPVRMELGMQAPMIMQIKLMGKIATVRLCIGEPVGVYSLP